MAPTTFTLRLLLTAACAVSSVLAVPTAEPVTFPDALANVTSLAASKTRRDSENILVIAARGSYQSPGVGSIGEIASRIQSQHPSVTISAVDYPATTTPAYLDSVATGVEALKSMIWDATQADPLVSIVLLGYSQGAQVVMDTLCGPTEDQVHRTAVMPWDFSYNIKAAVIAGDPTHDAQQSFVSGTATQDGVIPRDINFDCPPYTSRISSYCDAGDPYCATGNDINVHWSYMDKYADVAANWAVEQIDKYMID